MESLILRRSLLPVRLLPRHTLSGRRQDFSNLRLWHSRQRTATAHPNNVTLTRSQRVASPPIRPFNANLFLIFFLHQSLQTRPYASRRKTPLSTKYVDPSDDPDLEYDEDPTSDTMPPRKRQYAKRGSAAEDDFIDDSAETGSRKRSKQSKPATTAAVSTERQVDDDDNAFWEIGGRLRRATISEYKGSIFVNIREHYEKDGKVLPGKKGISLSIEQFNALMTVLPQLCQELSQQVDVGVVIPDFSGIPAKDDDLNHQAADEESQGENDDALVKKTKKARGTDDDEDE